jgi:hypothetical protein
MKKTRSRKSHATVLHNLKKVRKIYLLYQEIQKRLRTILVYAEMRKYLVTQEAVIVINVFAADPFKIFPFFCDILITRASFCCPFNHPHIHSIKHQKENILRFAVMHIFKAIVIESHRIRSCIHYEKSVHDIKTRWVI